MNEEKAIKNLHKKRNSHRAQYIYETNKLCLINYVLLPRPVHYSQGFLDLSCLVYSYYLTGLGITHGLSYYKLVFKKALRDLNRDGPDMKFYYPAGSG